MLLPLTAHAKMDAKEGCLRPYDSYIAANWQKGSWMAR